eukprot:196216_1
MNVVFYQLYLLHLIISQSQTINCKQDYACNATTINGCSGNQDCIIQCKGTNACYNSTIICPSDGDYDCLLACSGQDACKHVTISDATKFECELNGDTCNKIHFKCHNQKDCVINCTTNNCGGANFICPWSSTSSCIVFCDGGSSCHNSKIRNVNTVISTGTPRKSGIQDATIFCKDNQDCFVYNDGASAKVTIYCPNSNNKCEIHCVGRTSSCFRSKINGGGGDLIVKGTSEEGLKEVNIYCPSYKYCNISCFGESTCASFNVYSNIGTKLFIEAGGNSPLRYSYIECSNSSMGECHIYGYINATGMLDYATIYSLHQFSLTCDDILQCYSDFPGKRVTLYCTPPDLLNNCEITPSLINATGWECSSPTNIICNNLLTKTSNPTKQPTTTPTTGLPTFSPTRSFDENRILYVTKTGCDSGICDSLYGNFEQYCSNDYFMNVSNDYLIAKCCSNAQHNITMNNTIITPSECTNFPIVTINESVSSHTSHIKANTWLNEFILEDTSKTLCFEIDKGFQCIEPVISVLYEDIYYVRGPIEYFEEYLNVSYMTKTNYMNNEPCWGGVPGEDNKCNDWLDCDIDNQPNDGPWISQQGAKIFYLTNGPGVGDTCGGYNMNVNVTVTCSISYLNHSTCNTMNYVWQCFNGNNIQCANANYNGNGKIQIGQGIFNFNQTLQNKHNKIIMVGNGMNKTVINYDGNNKTVIDCSWIQCFITIMDLKYTTTNNDFTVYISNG